jgi:hypothetical protein
MAHGLATQLGASVERSEDLCRTGGRSHFPAHGLVRPLVVSPSTVSRTMVFFALLSKEQIRRIRPHCRPD